MDADELKERIRSHLRDAGLLKAGTTTVKAKGFGAEVFAHAPYEQPHGGVLPAGGAVWWRGEDSGWKAEWLQDVTEALNELEGVEAQVRRRGDGVEFRLPATGRSW